MHRNVYVIYECIGCIYIYIYIYIYIVYIVEQKYSDMVNCSWTYSSRLVLLYFFINSKHHKSDAFLITIQLLVVKKMKYICEKNRMCKASNCWKMTHSRLYLSTALLFTLFINNHRCKIEEHNKCSDMATCSWTYSSRRVSL